MTRRGKRQRRSVAAVAAEVKRAKPGPAPTPRLGQGDDESYIVELDQSDEEEDDVRELVRVDKIPSQTVESGRETSSSNGEAEESVVCIYDPSQATRAMASNQDVVVVENTVTAQDEVAGCSSSQSTGANQQLTLFHPRTGVALNMDEMIKNLTYLFFLNEHKKTPLKRSDIIREGMNGQFRCFDEVMTKLNQALDETLGVEVVGLEKRAKGGGYATYILQNKFKTDITEANIAAKGDKAKRGLLFVILCSTFMLQKGVDEDTIWQIITTLEFEGYGCPRRKEDLQKFVKEEYLTTKYLAAEAVHDSGSISFLYNWGPRSTLEVSKYSILKYVASTFPDTKPQDYEFQFNLLKGIERERAEMEADMAREGIVALVPTQTNDGQKETEADSESEDEDSDEDPEDAVAIFEKIIRNKKRLHEAEEDVIEIIEAEEGSNDKGRNGGKKRKTGNGNKAITY